MDGDLDGDLDGDMLGENDGDTDGEKDFPPIRYVGIFQPCFLNHQHRWIGFQCSRDWCSRECQILSFRLSLMSSVNTLLLGF